jgi:hypothetical protein
MCVFQTAELARSAALFCVAALMVQDLQAGKVRATAYM